jgi:hypothetical protein
MTDQPAEPRGWAFLVARGRRRGYQSILVPDFLAQSNEHGVLAESVHRQAPSSDAPRIEHLASPTAGPFAVVYRTQRLRYADLDQRPSPADYEAEHHNPDDLVTDEHGRPLDLLYGFVSQVTVREADEADLLAARDEALHVYRRFLTDETGFTLATSKPFLLRSRTGRPKPAIKAAPPPVAPPGMSPPGWSQPAGSAATRPTPARDRSRARDLAIVIIVVTLIVVAGISLQRCSRDAPDPDARGDQSAIEWRHVEAAIVRW